MLNNVQKYLLFALVLFPCVHILGSDANYLNTLWTTAAGQSAQLKDFFYGQWQKYGHEILPEYAVGASFLGFFGYGLWESCMGPVGEYDEDGSIYLPDDYNFSAKKVIQPDDWFDDTGAGLSEDIYEPSIFQPKNEVLERLYSRRGTRSVPKLLGDINKELSTKGLEEQRKLKLITIAYVLDPPYKGTILGPAYQQSLKAFSKMHFYPKKPMLEPGRGAFDSISGPATLKITGEADI